MEKEALYKGPMISSILFYPDNILVTNPGLYFAFKLKNELNLKTKNYISTLDNEFEPEIKTYEENYGYTSLTNEDYECLIYNYLRIAGREEEFIDIFNILPTNKIVAKNNIFNFSPISCFKNIPRYHTLSEYNNEFFKSQLLNSNSPKFLDYRKRYKIRYNFRGPRRFFNIFSFNNALN